VQIGPATSEKGSSHHLQDQMKENWATRVI